MQAELIGKASGELKQDILSATVIKTYKAERMIVQENNTKTEEVTIVSNVASSAPTKNVHQTEKSLDQKASAWDNIAIKKQILLEIKKPEISVVEIHKTDGFESSDTTRNMMEKVLFEYFYSNVTNIIKTSIEVTSKLFRKKIGFGFISENNRLFKSKILSVDKSLFFDTEKVKHNC